jgi:hypothetical protein
MARLPFGIGELTPSARLVRRRAREVGVGIPDMIAPSAYREVEPSDELVQAAGPLYAVLRDSRSETGVHNGDSGSGIVRIENEAGAEELAEKQDRELMAFDI